MEGDVVREEQSLPITRWSARGVDEPQSNDKLRFMLSLVAHYLMSLESSARTLLLTRDVIATLGSAPSFRLIFGDRPFAAELILGAAEYFQTRGCYYGAFDGPLSIAGEE